MKKKRILLCWGYNRRAWIEPFEKLKHDFDLVYLFFYHHKDEDACYTDCEKIYYKNFISARGLINKIRPEKIIFMAIETLLQIAINRYAQRKGIATYYMPHGISTLKLNEQLERVDIISSQATNLLNWSKLKNLLFSLRFFFLSVSLKEIKLICQALLYTYERYAKRQSYLETLYKFKYAWRYPSKYILFAKRDLPYFSEQDNVTHDKILRIGNIHFEEYYLYKQKMDKESSSYLLYIETPLVKIDAFPNDQLVMTRQEHNRLIAVIAGYAKKKELSLVVKLHPYNFDATDYIILENVEYVRDVNNIELLMEAAAVIGFDSSLMTMAAYFKKCCILIDKTPNSYQTDLIESFHFKCFDIWCNVDFPDFIIEEKSFTDTLTYEEMHINADLTLFPRENSSIQNLKQLLLWP